MERIEIVNKEIMNINFSQIKITDLILQASPFLFVDKLVDFNYKTYACKTSFLVSENSLLVQDNYLTEAGLLENIAQSSAVQIGFMNKYILKKDIQIGLLGAVKNLKISRLACLGDTLETTIEILTEFAGMKMVHCVVQVESETIAEGKLKIALKQNEVN